MKYFIALFSLLPLLAFGGINTGGSSSTSGGVTNGATPVFNGITNNGAYYDANTNSIGTSSVGAIDLTRGDSSYPAMDLYLKLQDGTIVSGYGADANNGVYFYTPITAPYMYVLDPNNDVANIQTSTLWLIPPGVQPNYNTPPPYPLTTYNSIGILDTNHNNYGVIYTANGNLGANESPDGSAALQTPSLKVDGYEYVNLSTITNASIKNLSVTGTNAYAMTSTGYTNLNSFEVRVSFSGTLVTFTNLTSKVGFSFGTITAPVETWMLHSNECLKGTGMAGTIKQ